MGGKKKGKNFNNLKINLNIMEYKTSVEELSEYFSEMALMRYRLMVEIEYLIALSIEKNINEIEPLTLEQQNKLKSYYKNFSNEDAQSIKKIEETTNHDVKAIEYFLKETDLNVEIDAALDEININDFPKDAESLEHMMERIGSFLDRIYPKNKDKTILFVCHGGIKRALITYILNKPVSFIKQIPKPENTAVSIFEIREDKKHKVHLLNCVKHLE